MKCPHGHHEIKLGYEKGSNAPYDKRCGIGIERYKDVCRQAIAEKKEKNKRIRHKVYLGSAMAVLSAIFGIAAGSVWFAIGMFSVMLTALLVLNDDIKRSQRLEEARKENVAQELNEFARNVPKTITYIQMPPKAQKERLEELVEETTEKLLKLL